MTESSFYREPTKLHGAKLADYSIERIDQGLEEVGSITIEESLGHAVKNGVMSASEAMDCLEAYHKVFDS